MLKYSENPKLPLEVVTTYSNEKEYRINCRKIKGLYYAINVDCFKVKNKWYRLNSNLILKDHETNVWHLLPEKYKAHYKYNDLKVMPSKLIIDDNILIKGIVKVNPDNTLELGYFSRNVVKNVGCLCINYGNIYAIDESILVNTNFIEHYSRGVFVQLETKPTSNDIREAVQITNIIDHRRQGYNIEDNEEEMSLKTNIYENRKVDIGKNIYSASKFLKGLKFGLELETSAGYLREDLQSKTGVVVCRDGSLHGGPEYTTIPLSGAKGINNILELVSYLKPRHTVDHFCSYHIHLSGVETSRTYIVALYRLSCMIQDELFKMFPIYKSDFKLAEKSRDYNQKLKLLNIQEYKGSSKEDFEMYIGSTFNTIFVFLTEGILPSKRFNRKNKKHPQSQKWNRNSRYYWINFMNCFFSSRNTIEFRLHHGTLNSTKIINWLYICAAIFLYAQQNINSLLTSSKKVTLKDVLYYYATQDKNEGVQLSNYLYEYYLSRVNFFDINKKDLIGRNDILNDGTYTFTSSNGYKFLF